MLMSVNVWLPCWNSKLQYCQFIQGHWRGLIIRNRSVWHTLFLLKVFTALKGTNLYIFIWILKRNNERIDLFCVSMKQFWETRLLISICYRFYRQSLSKWDTATCLPTQLKLWRFESRFEKSIRKAMNRNWRNQKFGMNTMKPKFNAKASEQNCLVFLWKLLTNFGRWNVWNFDNLLTLLLIEKLLTFEFSMNTMKFDFKCNSERTDLFCVSLKHIWQTLEVKMFEILKTLWTLTLNEKLLTFEFGTNTMKPDFNAKASEQNCLVFLWKLLTNFGRWNVWNFENLLTLLLIEKLKQSNLVWIRWNLILNAIASEQTCFVFLWNVFDKL